VRGGISIALVLSVPEFSQKPLILAATYAVVIISIVVQGLTLAPLVRKAAAVGIPVDRGQHSGEGGQRLTEPYYRFESLFRSSRPMSRSPIARRKS
jgi:NhaP-type Na+/H+ or K+/H+ antiporter